MKKNTKNYLISGIIFGTALAGSLYSANSQNVNAQNMPTAPNSTNQNGGMCMACPAMMAITSISEDGQPNCEKVQDPAGTDPSGATPAGYGSSYVSNSTSTQSSSINSNPGGPTYTNGDISSSSSKGLCSQCDGKTGNDYYNCIQKSACAVACAPNDPECNMVIPPDPNTATTQDCQMINGEYICSGVTKSTTPTTVTSSSSSSVCSFFDFSCLLSNPNFSNNTPNTTTTTNTSTTTTDGGRDGGYRDNTGGGYHDPSNGKNYSDQAGTHECSGRNCDGSNGDVVRT